MTLQVLVSTMNQKDYSLLEKMNIETDAIVVNQCDRDEIDRFEYKGHQIIWISEKARGVGLSRNTALMRATADIVLFADEDVVYDDGYFDKIINEFNSHPKMDMILMSLDIHNGAMVSRQEKKAHRVRLYNSLRYGAVHFACKRNTIFRNNIYFSLLFGGGARYGSGEDSLFIAKMLKTGGKIWVTPTKIGDVYQKKSTWFEGFNEKYFYDKGVLYYYLFRKMAYLLGVVLIVKNRKLYHYVGIRFAMKNMFKGIKNRR